jgi:hypothetical protein
MVSGSVVLVVAQPINNVDSVSADRNLIEISLFNTGLHSGKILALV